MVLDRKTKEAHEVRTMIQQPHQKTREFEQPLKLGFSALGIVGLREKNVGCKKVY